MNNNNLVRGLTLLSSVTLIIGTIIGSGIFLVPGSIAKASGSVGMIVIAWIIGGIISFMGAMCYAELGASMPSAGGEYVYLKEGYNPLFGFLYGWTELLVAKTASIASFAVGFVKYFSIFTDINPEFGKIISISLIWIFTFINYFGIRSGSIVQNIFTFLKIGSIMFIVVLAFTSTKGSVDNFTPLFQDDIDLDLIMKIFGIAMVSVFFAFDGWNNINMTAGEVKNPERNIPKALFTGLLICSACYIVINLAYIYILPISEIAGSKTVAAQTMNIILGENGKLLIAGMICVSVLGALNGSTLSGGRIYYAMALDNLFFRNVSKVHPKYRSPYISLLIQGFWASVIVVFFATFDEIVNYLVFASWIFYGLAAFSVILIRKNRPDGHRPYKMFGYPYVPIIFCIFTVFFLTNTLIKTPTESIYGLAIVLLGIPVYYIWKKKV